MIRLKLSTGKTIDLPEEEVKVFSVDDDGAETLLSDKTDDTNFDDIRELIRQNRERVVASNVFG